MLDKTPKFINLDWDKLLKIGGLSKKLNFVKDNKKNLNRVDCRGDTLLIVAAESYPDLVEPILKMGANPNLKGSDGKTALIKAASINLNLIAVLLKYKADPNICDGLEWNPLMTLLSWKVGCWNISEIKQLLEAGTDINAKNYKNWNALMLLVHESNSNSDLNILQYFLEFNPDLSVENSQGHTVFDIAKMNNPVAYDLLISYQEKQKLLKENNKNTRRISKPKIL